MLWSIGRYDFRLTEAQFWGLTWFQFAAISKRYDAVNERVEFSTGVIASAVYNAAGVKKTTGGGAWQPSDFMTTKAEVQSPVAANLHEKMKNIWSAMSGS